MLALTMAVLCNLQWPEKEWAFKPVEAGSTSLIHEKTVEVIRTEDELRRYMIRRGSPRRPLPKIDWKINQVIAVHVGSRPSAGYGVTVKHLMKTPSGGALELEETKPGPDSMVAQVITYPFALIRSERFRGVVGISSPVSP